MKRFQLFTIIGIVVFTSSYATTQKTSGEREFKVGDLLVFNGTQSSNVGVPNAPVFIKVDGGWRGLYAVNDEFAEFLLKGKDIKLQDPFHVLFENNIGLNITFADKKEFGAFTNLLEAHIKWELDYWQASGNKVRSQGWRKDMTGTRSDVRVTEFELGLANGRVTSNFMIALASKGGVIVLAVSCSKCESKKIFKIAEGITNSAKMNPSRLTAEEIKKLTQRETRSN